MTPTLAAQLTFLLHLTYETNHSSSSYHYHLCFSYHNLLPKKGHENGFYTLLLFSLDPLYDLVHELAFLKCILVSHYTTLNISDFLNAKCIFVTFLLKISKFLRWEK